MKFQFWAIGKNHEPYVKEGVELFTKRISNYYAVEWNLIPMPKNAASLSESELKKKKVKQLPIFCKKKIISFCLTKMVNRSTAKSWQNLSG